jgi:hypothetical protein
MVTMATIATHESAEPLLTVSIRSRAPVGQVVTVWPDVTSTPNPRWA